MKEQKKIYNHYVPQFYLKNYSKNGKSVGAYNFSKERYVDYASIKKIGGKNRLYGDDNLLEDWFSDLEGDWATIIRKIIKFEQIPKDDDSRELLYRFIYLSKSRTMEVADSYRELYIELYKITARSLINERGMKVPDYLINTMDVEVERPNLPAIQAMEETLAYMNSLHMAVIINKSTKNFITSDVPLALYNQLFIKRQYYRDYGFGHLGFQCFIPLNLKICLCLYDDEVYNVKLHNNNRIFIYNKKHISELNKLFLFNAYKEVYFENGSKRDIAEIVPLRPPYKSNTSIFGPIIYHGNRCVHEYIDLPSFKIKNHYLETYLPTHLGGPLRPIAEEFEKMNNVNIRNERN